MTLYFVKEHILYNSVDPDQTTISNVAGSGAQLLHVREVLMFFIPDVKFVYEYDFVYCK